LNEAERNLTAVLAAAGVRAVDVQVRDRTPKRSAIPFCFQDWHHPGLARVRRKYQLEEAIGGGKSEFERMLLLRKRVHDAIPSGAPAHGVLDVEAILDAAAKGGKFYCTHYAWTYMSLAVALGWQARKLGVDSRHDFNEDSTHHGVAEIWSNDFAKWFVVDAMYDQHYEKDGVPLSALELRDEVIRNGCADVETRVGPERRLAAIGSKGRAFDSPECYFWFHVATRNDFFSLPERFGNYRQMLYMDGAGKSAVWYQGKGTEGKSYPHVSYRGMFQLTENAADLYPEIGTLGLAFDGKGKRGAVTVTARHFTPNFKCLRVETNGRSRHYRGDSFTWRPAKGRNALVVRTVNLAGITGPPASVSLFVEG